MPLKLYQIIIKTFLNYFIPININDDDHYDNINIFMLFCGNIIDVNRDDNIWEMVLMLIALIIIININSIASS